MQALHFQSLGSVIGGVLPPARWSARKGHAGHGVWETSRLFLVHALEQVCFFSYEVKIINRVHKIIMNKTSVCLKPLQYVEFCLCVCLSV